MAEGERAAPLLHRFNATAYLMGDTPCGWRAIAEAA